ncbi:MAG: UvrD-helicase domain-containing protein [Rhizorhabdus sp.]|uniref:ATP-dependent helicase n=1 Tax=Rhizorhabdus sp. TaxID=1968843 RepID=UPI001B6842DE|nr:ATP-dependent helicase [Rhizorhabdus sp.]MBP8232237.1 UvrD-helicase domain-containing protein [Rhizorhabdus sp.]
MTKSLAAPLLEKLNGEQRAAALETERPSLVLSGAGTGKTTLLIAKVGVCLDRGYEPHRIAISTFRATLAQEFRVRAQQAFGRRIAQLLLMGTCHSLMGRLLRSRPEVAGLSEHYEIADEAASRRAMTEAVEKFPQRLVDPSDRKQMARVGKWLGRVKAAGVPPAEAEAWVDELLQAKAIVRDQEGEGAADGEDLEPELRRLAAMWPDLGGTELPLVRAAAAVYPAYQKILRDRDLADFTDLILWPVLAMRKDAGALSDFQRCASTWLVDEYQDSSDLQVEAFDLLARRHRRLAAIGDDDQSIYGFSGATTSGILGFPDRWPDAQVFRLIRNYRCSPIVLDAANALIEKNADRFAKRLVSGHRGKRGENIVIASASSREDGAFWAAGFIADWLEELGDDGTVFVLYRQNWQTRVLEEALVEAGISYGLVGDVSFYERQEIRDALSYLLLFSASAAPELGRQLPAATSAVIGAPRADDAVVAAWERIANMPVRGLGKKSLDAIHEFWVANPETEDLLAAGLEASSSLKGKAAEGAAKLADLRDRWLETSGKPLGDRLWALLRFSGYLSFWETHDDPSSDQRLKNLEELARVVDGMTTIPEVFGHAALSLDSVDAEAKVRLMTFHASKGLEADICLLADMMEGIAPTKPALVAEEQGEGALVQEERRAAYVALTRTIVQAAVIVNDVGQTSRFLDEMLDGVEDHEVERVLAPARGARKSRRPRDAAE